jgi:hypothetical protein
MDKRRKNSFASSNASTHKEKILEKSRNTKLGLKNSRK